MSIMCKCGCENSDSALHCENCGEKLGVQQGGYNPYQPVQEVYPQNNYGQNAYAQPQQPYYQPAVNQGEQPLSIGAWVGLLLLFAIPFVNIIALIVVLCVTQNKTLRNYVIAQFIIVGISVALVILLVVAIGASAFEFAEYLYSNY